MSVRPSAFLKEVIFILFVFLARASEGAGALPPTFLMEEGIFRYVWARTSSLCNLLSKRVKGLVKMSRSRRQRGEGGRRQSVFLYHLVSLLRSVPPPPLLLRGNLLHSFFPSFLPSDVDAPLIHPSFGASFFFASQTISQFTLHL